MAVGVLVLAVIVAISPSRGRASPLGIYRPPVPTETLASKCFPLPDGVRLDFPHQVRSDASVGHGRRRLVVQYDLVGAATVVARLTDALTTAGFTAVPGSVGGGLRFDRGDVGPVEATVEPYQHLPGGSIVRGQVVLDLPVTPVGSASRQCADPGVTKRGAGG
ncbi:hypothetical protein GCM10009798_35700 [Nocardioides panacihumi]|uniref:LytR family transcriptional regulator n=1 Tax=Nocardioides panacihumi TaxID=400774 RepID=A0ABN2RMB6_9ACTN